MYINGNMITEDKASLFSDLTFDSILNETCERLMDRQAKLSIQRIYELEKRLEHLEHELDEFLGKRF
jgi:hypothetical protein